MNWGLNPPTPRQFQPCFWVANARSKNTKVDYFDVLIDRLNVSALNLTAQC